jgi:hypothetical protein
MPLAFIYKLIKTKYVENTKFEYGFESVMGRLKNTIGTKF